MQLSVRAVVVVFVVSCVLAAQRTTSLPTIGVLTADCGSICDLAGRRDPASASASGSSSSSGSSSTANATSSFDAPLCIRRARTELGCRDSARTACVDDPTGLYQCVDPAAAAGSDWMSGFSGRADALMGYVHPDYGSSAMAGDPLLLDPSSLTSIDGLALPTTVVDLYVGRLDIQVVLPMGRLNGSGCAGT